MVHDKTGPDRKKLDRRNARQQPIKFKDSGFRTGKMLKKKIKDYLSYTVKVSELLESYTLISVLHYDDQYRKLQHEYKFRWGSDSQHLHTRFLKRRERPNLSNLTSASGTATHSSFVSPTAAPICRQFNSALGCQWPNCRFAHICIVKGCGKPHSQTKHTLSPPSPLGNMYAPTF